MKGDDIIKKVILRFLGLGIKDRYQAEITIYDNNNNIIYKGKTYNGYLNINLCINTSYKICARFINNSICRKIYINNKTNIYNFCFNEANIITFLLNDSYYPGLKIERGEIILWQNQ